MVYFGFDDMSHKAEGKKERKKERREIICTSKRMYIICTYHVSSVLLDKSLHLILHV